ncbi:hypothetical protein BaRGS_00025271, partial [Batillaria attramentaria]
CEEEKVAAVRNWKVPTTTTEVRQFLGFASYYRRFIAKFQLQDPCMIWWLKQARAPRRQPSPSPVVGAREDLAVQHLSVSSTTCDRLAANPTADIAPPARLQDPVVQADKVADPAAATTEVFPHLSPAQLQRLQQEDADIGTVLASMPNKLQSPKEASLRALVRQHPRLTMQNGLLYRRVTLPQQDTVLQLVLPSSLRPDVIQALHDRMGHQGVERTLELLRSRVYWPGMHADVKDYVAACERCAMGRHQRLNLPSGHLLASRPLEILAMDFTKFDDQGRNFESQVVQQLCQLYNIKKTRTTPYHPQGNGQCERFNRTLHDLLRTLPAEQKTTWPRHLPELVQAYNVTPHASTGFSPHFLLFGQEPRLPVDDLLGLPSNTSAVGPRDYVRQHQHRLNQAHARANDNLQKAAADRARQTDKGSADHPLHLGDFVYLRNRVLGRNKFQDRWRPQLYVVTRRPYEDSQGVSTCALIDTGSQVTTVTENFYCQYLKDSSSIQPAQFLTLRAANGLEVPYVGIVVVDLVAFGQTLEAVPVLVTKDCGNPEKLRVPVLLGMNVLQQITGGLASSDFPPVLQPLMQEVKLETRSIRGVARVAGGCCIPAYSAATIKITSTQKSCDPLLASPLAQPLPQGLLLIPTLVSDQPSQRYVRLVNITSEDCILPARTPVAQLHAASCFEGQDIQVRANCSQLTVDIERVSTDPAAPGTVPCPDFDGDDEDRQQLQQLLDRYAHVFAQDDTLGYTDIVQHRIPTTDNVPVSQPYRSIPPTQLQEVKEHLQGLLQSGAIVPSHSPYAAPVVGAREDLAVQHLSVSSTTCDRLAANPTADIAPPARLQDPVVQADKVADPAAATTEVFPHLSPAQLQRLQQEDADIGTVLASMPNKLQSPKEASLRALVRQHPRLTMQNGLLYRRVTLPQQDTVLQLVLPSSLRPDVIQALHDRMGHQGVERTLELLRSRVYWPGMHADVKDYVAACERCAMGRHQRLNLPSGHLLASRPLEILAMDFTKFDDQGRNFESQVVQQLCQLYNIKKTRTTPYHPQGNGQCERFNRTLHDLLRTLPAEQKTTWPRHLPELVQAYNVTPHASTGFSPHFLLFGQEPRLPVDDLLGLPSNTSAVGPRDYVRQHQHRLNQAHARANDNLQKAAADRARQTDKGSADHPLHLGDFVYLRNRVLGRNKFQDRWRPQLYVVTRRPYEDSQVYAVKPVA